MCNSKCVLVNEIDRLYTYKCNRGSTAYAYRLYLGQV